MGIALTLDPVELDVAPGQEARCEITMRNTGAIVDQFTLDVIGDAKSWTEIEPPIINLFPDAESTARLLFRPPKNSEVLAGEFPFAVRALSREDPDGSVIEEGAVTVGSFTEITAEFVPHGSRGSFRTRHRLAIDNRGNIPTPVNVGVADPDSQLLFKIRRTALTIQPGTAVLIPVWVIPKKRFLKGPKKTHPFQGVITGDGFAPVTADAAMVQEQLLPTWLPKVLAGLVAMLITLAILWFTLLRPVIKTEAQNAANQQTQQLSSGVAVAQSQASAAQAKASDAQSQATGADQKVDQNQQALAAAGIPIPGSSVSPGAGSGTAGAGRTPSAGSSTPPPAAGGQSSAPAAGSGGQGAAAAPASPSEPPATPVSAFSGTSTAAGQSSTTIVYTVPGGKSLLLTDWVVSNPNGDSGDFQIRSNSSTVIALGLDNFRTSDQHFVQPLVFGAGTQINVAVACRNTGSACTPSVLISGRLQ